MTKKKFSREERNAIIKKLTKIADERARASWEKHRAAYRPSAEYQKAKMLIAQRNNACKELREFDPNVFLNWNYFTQIKESDYLDQIRDNEIRHLVERYEVNETDLDVELILADQESPVDDLIECLLRNCLCK
jgi:hypothetical protein